MWKLWPTKLLQLTKKHQDNADVIAFCAKNEGSLCLQILSTALDLDPDCKLLHACVISAILLISGEIYGTESEGSRAEACT